MRRIVFLVIAADALALTCRLFAGDTPDSGDEFAKVKSEYTDVFALRGHRERRDPGHRQNSSCETQDRGRSDGGEWRILFQQRPRHDGSLCHDAGKHS